MADALALDAMDKATIGVAAGSSGLDFVSNLWNNILNTKYAAEDRAFRQKVYDETKEREDTAIQRRIADAAAAGISPLAVVGQGAGASAGGSSVSAGMPNIKNMGFDSLAGDLMGLQQTKANIRLAEAQADERQAEAVYKMQLTENTKILAEKIVQDMRLTDEQIASMKIDNKWKALKDSIIESVPEKYRNYIIAQFEQEDFKNKLMSAQTKKAISDIVNDSIRTGFQGSQEARNWVALFLPWKR